jgi:hypothetical protein
MIRLIPLLLCSAVLYDEATKQLLHTCLQDRGDTWIVVNR